MTGVVSPTETKFIQGMIAQKSSAVKGDSLSRDYIARREAMFEDATELDREMEAEWERKRLEKEYREAQAERSLDGYSAMPSKIIGDRRLKSYHVDILMGLLAYTETAHQGKVFITKPDLGTADLARFTRTARSNLATYLHDLKRWRYITFELEGTWIYGIRWNLNTTGIARGLRQRDPFIRVPNPVIHDTSLSPRQRHAYVTLCWLAFDLASRVRDPARKLEADTKPFHCTVSLLAKNMRVSDSTAKRALKELEELHLIEYVELDAIDRFGKKIQQTDRHGNLVFDAAGDPVWKKATLRGAKPLMLVPMLVRYAYIRKEKAGQRTPSFIVRPNFDRAWAAYQDGIHPGSMEVPEVEVQGLHSPDKR